MLALVSLGARMALFGLILGAASFFTTGRWARPAPGPYTRGQQRAAKAMAKPLLVVGVAGVVLCIVGLLRS